MKRFIHFCFAMLSAICVKAQTDSTDLTTTDSIIPARSTLTFGLVYANDASYYGQKADVSNPYIALAVSYRLPSGFYLTGQGYRLLKDSSGLVSAGSLGLGWDIRMSKRWSLDLSYSHTFFAAHSPLLQVANANNAGITLTHKSWIDISASGDYAFGKTNDFFVTGAISKEITLGSLSKKDILSITPSFSIIGGTQRFYGTYITEKAIRDSILGIPVQPSPLLPTLPVIGSPLPIPNPNPGPSPNPDPETDPVQQPGSEPEAHTITTTSFNLLSYNFRFPLAYSRARYMLEAAYQLSLVSRKAQLNPGGSNSFFTLSFYYQF